MENNQTKIWWAGCAAALILAVGMGFGRFAFTAVYPYMVTDKVLSLQSGSLAASANYTGYLIGALLAVRLKTARAHFSCLQALIGTVICLLLLKLPLPEMLIITVRGVAGIFSAFAIISASLWLLVQRGFSHGAPILYSGVGLGIALSSELVVYGVNHNWHSPQLWLMLGISSLLIMVIITPTLLTKHHQNQISGLIKTAHALSRSSKSIVPLAVIYGLAGFGYIITATYLPLLAKMALPSVNVGHIWAVFGLGAIPSCFLWHALHKRLGGKIGLVLNLLVQASGVLIPVILPNAAGYLLSALLVGGTFMGTVTIVMPLAQHLAKNSGKNLMAVVTVAYSVGQILGPLVAGGLYQYSHGFSGSLSAASAALLIAALITGKSIE